MAEHKIGTHSRPAAMTSARTSAAALLAIAGGCWIVAASQMNGMDMGTKTTLGSFPFFIGVWVSMMAAMMLPGAVPAVLGFVATTRRAIGVPLFAASYLAVWTLFGLVVYSVYQPHRTWVAGALTIGAGLYEVTPIKRRCRRRCHETMRSGLQLGVYCVGSSVGLMVMLAALGVMNVGWMALVAALVLVQKLLRPRWFIDVPVAIGIVTLGVAVLTRSA